MRQRAALACGCAALIAGCGGGSMQPVATGPPGGRAATLRATDCPRTPGGRLPEGVAIALGRGPAYPVLGLTAAPPDPAGVVVLEDDARVRGRYLQKTLWAIRPGTREETVVRGEALSGTGRVSFYAGPQPRSLAVLRRGSRRQLRLPSADESWVYAVTTTVLPGPGCYAFRLRRAGLTQRIVFRAVARRRALAIALERALRGNPNNEASVAACRPARARERARAIAVFGRTRRPLFVCRIAVGGRGPETFDVQVLGNGCFVGAARDGRQGDFGCIR